jgi:hypothetical protein
VISTATLFGSSGILLNYKVIIMFIRYICIQYMVEHTDIMSSTVKVVAAGTSSIRVDEHNTKP